MMSEVSFIPAAPSSPAPQKRLQTDPAAARASGSDAPATPAPKARASADLTNKTKLQIDPLPGFAFAYTFLNAQTMEIVSRWPEPSTYQAVRDIADPGRVLQALV
jgi:hypothetical protein